MVGSTRHPAFSWGTATSAFQIEGAVAKGGRGESIWDRFGRDGHVPEGWETACDHYHRLETDLDLLGELGVSAYRFSVAWPRVIPDGSGEVNSRGLDFYYRLVDGLLERGIEPWVTLYHWDLPQALQDRGGWANRETTRHFARYAEVVAQQLGDRVSRWITHNEPWVAAYLGHLYGVFAPGERDWGTTLRAAHHLLLSHGLAAEAIRGQAGDHRVGIALDCRPLRSVQDREAARRFDGLRNRWFFDPVFGKGYPDDVVGDLVDAGRLDTTSPEFIEEGDMDLIATPLDFLGVNYYTTLPVTSGEPDDPERPPDPDPEEGFTEMGWAIDPDGLRDYLIELNGRYSPAEIAITENGASFSDRPDSDGVVDDQRRIEYIRVHIDAIVEAAEAGVPMSGYFVWSLLDNLEWTSGFDQRFGLVWVDHETQERIPKASFEWYSNVVHEASPQSQALREAS